MIIFYYEEEGLRQTTIGLYNVWLDLTLVGKRNWDKENTPLIYHIWF